MGDFENLGSGGNPQYVASGGDGASGIVCGEVFARDSEGFGVVCSWGNISCFRDHLGLVLAGWDLLLLGVLQATVHSGIMADRYWKTVLIFGMNPMLVFFFSGIIPRVLGMIKIGDEGLTSWIYSQGIEPLFAEKINASLAGALIYVLIWAAILFFFDARKRYYKV